MKFVECSAKTMEEAVNAGLEQLGVTLADVNVEVVDSGSKGLFGFLGTKPVVVRLTVREEEAEESIISSIKLDSAAQPKEKVTAEAKKEEEKPARQTREKQPAREKKAEHAEAETKAEKPARQPKAPKAETSKTEAPDKKNSSSVSPADDEAKERTLAFLTELTRLMGVEVSINIRIDEEGNLRVEMFGDTLGILIGRRGETLDALQYLTSLYVNRGREDYVRVTLDTENYRAKREDSLRRLANRMANRVVKTGKKVKLEPMNPYERRILHSALQQNDAVATHSEGEEPNRHVVITLKQKSESKAE